ncbi:transposase [Streptococcus agalactiae]|uniref:transposase n=1 Tax=Bacilli TaxID=91061 RepID=UPI000EB6A65B|nr:hypothetical protein SAGS_1096 [Streptococcus agalactiae]
MTQVHFTLKSEEIQSIIEYSVKDDVSKNILTTVFNQLMENQRTEYIQAKEYERTENRQSQRNGYYERSFTTRVGTLELKVPRTRDGHFHPQCLNVINETKSPHGFNVGNVCIRRFNS